MPRGWLALWSSFRDFPGYASLPSRRWIYRGLALKPSSVPSVRVSRRAGRCAVRVSGAALREMAALLALSLMIALRDLGDPLPAACALFSPWTDLAATGDSILVNDHRCAMFRGAIIAPIAKYYLGSADPKNPRASPLYANLEGLPPLLIHVGEQEVLLDDSQRLADRARAAHAPVELKIWPDVCHGWQNLQVIPEARQSLEETSQFFFVDDGPHLLMSAITLDLHVWAFHSLACDSARMKSSTARRPTARMQVSAGRRLTPVRSCVADDTGIRAVDREPADKIGGQASTGR